MAQVTITLDHNDLGQIVDGLRERMESYDRTAAFFDDEELNIENAILEEVTDAAEAQAIAANYKRIIDDIERQLAERV